MVEESLMSKVLSLGDFYPFEILIDVDQLMSEIEPYKDSWVQYNCDKKDNPRKGLSLFSLDGDTSGEIDLNSLRDYNKKHRTEYDELDFNVPTEIWGQAKSLSSFFQPIEKNFGRTHLIHLSSGGFFPPHRDLGNSIRLISVLRGAPISMVLNLESKNLDYQPGRVYFMNTRKAHSVFSMDDESLLLVINLKLDQFVVDFIVQNLQEY